MESVNISKHLIAGLFLRLSLVMYGLYQDANSIVSYTDIDYSVYTDAARYVVNGVSPYRRETYRYTPILAWMLTPSITLWPSYGKVLFCLFDILAAYLMFLIVKRESGGDRKLALKCTSIWIYNPLPMIICSRGSCESIILCLVLSILYLFHVGAIGLAGFMYGMSVHFKLYPLPYCLPLYLAADGGTLGQLPILKNLFTITKPRVRLIVGSILGFGIPTAISYMVYGNEFLEETYFYHLTRKDIKHNFSPYFYSLYLSWDDDGLFLKLFPFLPQLVLLVAVAFLYRTKNDLSFTLFFQTAVFVTFNKVCTSQYFLWYLSLVPVLVPKLTMKWTHALILLVVWYFAQISWLLPAYYLEFEGRNTYTYVWLESIAFFCANVGILVQMIKSYNKHVLGIKNS